MLHVDKRCRGSKRVEVSHNMQILRGWLPRRAVQTDFTHGRLSTPSPTMSSLRHSSSIWVKTMPTKLSTIIIMMDGKRWYTCAADGDASSLLHHVAWI